MLSIPSSPCAGPRAAGNEKAWPWLPRLWPFADPPCSFRFPSLFSDRVPVYADQVLLCRSNPVYVDQAPVYPDSVSVYSIPTLFMQTTSLCAQTTSLFVDPVPVYPDPDPLKLNPSLVYPGPHSCLQKPWRFAESQLPGTSSRPEGWFPFVWLATRPSQGLGSGYPQGPAMEGRCCEPLPRTLLRFLPLLPRLWHCF